jgi:hypothetical protein
VSEQRFNGYVYCRPCAANFVVCRAKQNGKHQKRQAEGISSAHSKSVHPCRPCRKLPLNFGEPVEQWELKQIPLQKVLEQCGGDFRIVFLPKTKKVPLFKTSLSSSKLQKGVPFRKVNIRIV